MNQLPTINKSEADKKFRLAFWGSFGALGLSMVFFLVGSLAQRPDFQIICAVGVFVSFLISVYAIICMLVIKQAIRCHEEYEEPEKPEKQKGHQCRN